MKERRWGHARLVRDEREADHVGAQFRERTGTLPGGLDRRIQRGHDLTVIEFRILIIARWWGIVTRKRGRVATCHGYPAVGRVSQLEFIGHRARGWVSEVRQG